MFAVTSGNCALGPNEQNEARRIDGERHLVQLTAKILHFQH
jgi:hypothetical protein